MFVDVLARGRGRRRRRGVLLAPLRGDVPADVDGPRGDLPLRRRAPPRARRRARTASPLRLFADAHVTVESAPVARQALSRGSRHRGARRRRAPESPRSTASLVCATRDSSASPIAAAGRWMGVILADRGPGRAAAGRRRAPPAVDARQDRRARRASPASRRTRQRTRARARSSASTSRATSTRASSSGCSASRSRCPPSAALSRRGARALRRRGAGRARRPARRAPAPARPLGAATDAARRSPTSSTRLQPSTPTSALVLAARVRRSVTCRPSSSRSRSPSSPRRSATRTSTREPTPRRVTLAHATARSMLEVTNDGVHARLAAPGDGPAARRARGAAGRRHRRVRRARARGPGRCAWSCPMTAPDVNPSRLATAAPSALRVLVVDDHEVVHWGFRLMLGEQPWVERCLSARNGRRGAGADHALRARTSRSSTSSSARSRAPRSASALREAVARHAACC